MVGLGGWFVYAYRNPNTKSGRWLIEVTLCVYTILTLNQNFSTLFRLFCSIVPVNCALSSRKCGSGARTAQPREVPLRATSTRSPSTPPLSCCIPRTPEPATCHWWRQYEREILASVCEADMLMHLHVRRYCHGVVAVQRAVARACSSCDTSLSSRHSCLVPLRQPHALTHSFITDGFSRKFEITCITLHSMLLEVPGICSLNPLSTSRSQDFASPWTLWDCFSMKFAFPSVHSELVNYNSLNCKYMVVRACVRVRNIHSRLLLV